MLSAGLASDGLSAENALMILHAVRPPLIIDPSSQALQWLQAHLKASNTNFEIVKMQDDRSEIMDVNQDLQLIASLSGLYAATNCPTYHTCAGLCSYSTLPCTPLTTVCLLMHSYVYDNLEHVGRCCCCLQICDCFGAGSTLWQDTHCGRFRQPASLDATLDQW